MTGKTTTNPDDEPIMKKKSKLPISLITATLAVVAGGGAFYFINSQKDLKIDNDSKSDVIEQQVESITELKVENIDFGYKGNLELNLEIPEKKVEGNLKLENFQILSMDKGLKSVFSFDKIYSIAKKEGDDPIEFQINNFDITTNEEVSYIHMEGDKLKKVLEDFLLDKDILNSMFESNKYIKLDEAKPIIELLGSDDETINNFIKGFVSSNPIHYWEKYGITEKIRKKLFSKNSYKLFFKELETIDGKTYIGLKNNVCEFAIKITEKLGQSTPISVDDCKTQLVMINDKLGESLYITQNEDTETINYENENLKIILSYNNGEILAFNLENPFLPAINYEEKLLTIKYNSGKIGEQVGVIAKLNSEFNFEELTYKISANYKQGINEWKISGKGNQELGKIAYMFTENGVIVSKGQYQYQGGNHGLTIKDPLMEISGKLLNNKEKKQWQFSGKWGNNFETDKKKNNIQIINTVLLMVYEDEGVLPIEGLTPIYYQGEIIAYQGEATPYLNLDSFDAYISNIPSNEDGYDSIVSISADGTKYSIATIIKENKTFQNYIKGNNSNGISSYDYSLTTDEVPFNITIKEDQTIKLNSLIYKGEYKNGVYSIEKTELENENDLSKFISNSNLENLVYKLVDSKENKFNNSILSKGLLEYNGSGEINTVIINLKADYINGGWNSQKLSTNTNLSLKDGNLQLSIKHNQEGNEIFTISGNGKRGVNNTDLNLLINTNGETIPVTLKHENNISKSTVNIESSKLELSSEISSNMPIAGLFSNVIGYSFYQYINYIEQWIIKSKDSRRIGDVRAMNRALMTWLSDFESNPDNILPTGGLTPISYKGEIIAYQGNFSDYFEGSLKESGFDVLQKTIKDPEGEEYIVAISANGKLFSVAATIENAGSPITIIEGNVGTWTEMTLKNGDKLDIESIIYELEDGKILKTELETEEDLKGFLKDEDNRLVYNIKPNNNENSNNTVKLIYNSTQESNNSIINGSYNISKGEENILSINLKGNISTNGFTYKIPTDIEEINWLDNYNSNEIDFNTSSLSSLSKSQSRARDTARKADLTMVLTSMKMYYDDEGEYPEADKLIDLQDITDELNPYMSKIPTDPNDGKKYYYSPLKSAGTIAGAAILVAELENKDGCNFEADSIEKLQEIIEEYNGEMKELIKLKKKDEIDSVPCFYVVFPN